MAAMPVRICGSHLSPPNVLHLHTKLCGFSARFNSSNPGPPIDVKPVKRVRTMVPVGVEQRLVEATPTASMRQKMAYVGPHGTK